MKNVSKKHLHPYRRKEIRELCAVCKEEAIIVGDKTIVCEKCKVPLCIKHKSEDGCLCKYCESSFQEYKQEVNKKTEKIIGYLPFVYAGFFLGLVILVVMIGGIEEIFYIASNAKFLSAAILMAVLCVIISFVSVKSIKNKMMLRSFLKKKERH